jgi:hypothetical protein
MNQKQPFLRRCYAVPLDFSSPKLSSIPGKQRQEKYSLYGNRTTGLIVTVPNALIIRFGFLLAGCEITKRADYATTLDYAAHF